MSPENEPESSGSAETIRGLIADDHAVVRRGLRQVLDGKAGVEVVAEAPDLTSARRYVRGHHPDVLAHLSVRTVATDRAHIQQTLRLVSRADPVHYALAGRRVLGR